MCGVFYTKLIFFIHFYMFLSLSPISLPSRYIIEITPLKFWKASTILILMYFNRVCYNIRRVLLNYYSRQSGGESTSGELHVAFRIDHFFEMSYEHLLEKDSKLQTTPSQTVQFGELANVCCRHKI